MITSILLGKWGGWPYTPAYERAFYRLKALICCLLNREPNYFVRSWDYQHVIIAYTDGGRSWSEYGTSYWYECIIVGTGLFRNWWCTYNQGSSD